MAVTLPLTSSNVSAGAKLDVWLAKRRGYGDVHMSRALVMRRYHGSVSWLDTIVYRIRLLQVCCRSGSGSGLELRVRARAVASRREPHHQ